MKIGTFYLVLKETGDNVKNNISVCTYQYKNKMAKDISLYANNTTEPSFIAAMKISVSTSQH